MTKEKPTTSTIDANLLGAFIMIASALLALILTNIGFGAEYHSLISAKIQLGYSSYALELTVKDWIKDMLMAFFFLNITLELKSEFYEGFLTDKKQFILPLIATFGGMLFPAICYVLINYNYPDNLVGFAIPCATDIAFAMCVFALLGKNLSPAIKVFLLSIAIFDDLGAMLIIAIFYNHQLQIIPALLGTLITGVMLLLCTRRTSNFTPYFILAPLLWLACYLSGVHSTMSGVILGACIPMYSKDQSFSPLKKLNALLNPWVQFIILPIFAFVASGVSFVHLEPADILNPISLGIIVGLFFGKQIGVFLCTWIAVKLRIAPLPARSNWFEVYFASCLAGIGFTMSLFMGSLAFDEGSSQDFVQLGVLTSSLLTVIYSTIIIRMR